MFCFLTDRHGYNLYACLSIKKQNIQISHCVSVKCCDPVIGVRPTSRSIWTRHPHYHYAALMISINKTVRRFNAETLCKNMIWWSWLQFIKVNELKKCPLLGNRGTSSRPGCNVVNLAIVINDNNLVNYNIIILHTGPLLDNDWDCLHYFDYVQCL